MWRQMQQDKHMLLRLGKGTTALELHKSYNRAPISHPAGPKAEQASSML
jgi:hypothetical protein